MSNTYARYKKARSQRFIILTSQMAYRKARRRAIGVGLLEGGFFGLMTGILQIFAGPSVKTLALGLLGYSLFVIVRGLIDYSRIGKPGGWHG